MADSKWVAVGSCVTACVISIGAAAQAPRPQQSREKVTVVGCVLRDSAVRPTRAVANAPSEFLLVTRAGAATAADAVGTSGGGTAERTAYGLIGPEERQLGRHVGQRVEIVGTLEPEPRDTQQPTGGATDPRSGAGAPPGVPESLSGSNPRTAVVQRLNIISVKRAGGAC